MTFTDSFSALQTYCAGTWPAIEQARQAARHELADLHRLLAATPPRLTSSETSIVVFGSLARGEWTPASDLDWTLLIDGYAASEHLETAQAVATRVKGSGRKGPGPTGVFGHLAFSHELVHQIGGGSDTNHNMTQRLLLLLESKPVGDAAAYDRVIRSVLRRYLEENRPLDGDATRYKVPRFLLNDLTRFWRTMAVDFASKQRERAGIGWGLRNSKLRFSRKLLYAAGLIACFTCAGVERPTPASPHPLQTHLRQYVEATPLEVVAHALITHHVPAATCRLIMDAYNGFLEILQDVNCRLALDGLTAKTADTDPVFQQVRLFSRYFNQGLTELFFDQPPFAALTRQYGLF